MDARSARRLLADNYDGWSARNLNFDGLDLSSLSTGNKFLSFDRCSFVGTDLRQATLDRASFKLCDFSSANLRGASVRGTGFAGCDLRGADFRDTDLSGARFNRIMTGDLTGRTDATGARLDRARLPDVVLEDVVGWPAD